MKKLRVLVVDDKWMSADIAAIHLESMGHECFLAENGQEALDTLLKEDFDVILTDLNMPVMDGLELTHILRYNPTWARFSKIRIVMNSEIKDDRILAKAAEAGVDVFIDKGCLEQELSAALVLRSSLD